MYSTPMEGTAPKRSTESRATLEQLVPPAPLADRATSDEAFFYRALENLVLLMEQQAPEMIGSVLLLDVDGVTLHHGAAPNLPVEYCRLIDGSRIGPVAGSCGTAAWRGTQVIVRDITTDPLWADYRQDRKSVV